MIVLCTTVACGGDNEESTPQTMAERYTLIGEKLDEFSLTELENVGDAKTYSAHGIDAKIQRIDSSNAFSISHSVNNDTVEVEGADTILSSASDTMDLRLLIAEEDPFDETESSTEMLSATVQFLVTTQEAEAFNDIDTEADLLQMTLPCDVSRCDEDCLCECQGREMEDEDWTRTDVVTTYDDDDPKVVSCAYSDTDTLIAAFEQTECLAGSFSGSGSIPCTDCDPGREQPEVGQTSCLICEPGTYAPEAGTQTCLLCPAGTFAAFEGSSECNDCPDGMTSEEGASECVEE